MITALHLQYTYPAGTTPGDDPRLRGEPDSSLFNRHEKHEVLYFLNKLVAKYPAIGIAGAQKAERMIQQHLPGDVRSQVNVLNWIESNWASYQ